MKKKITPVKEPAKVPEGHLITRKQALQRSGYMALSAATMLLLLNKNVQAQSSPAAPPGGPKSPEKPDGIWND